MSRSARASLTIATCFLGTQIVGYLLLAVFTATANDETAPSRSRGRETMTKHKERPFNDKK